MSSYKTYFGTISVKDPTFGAIGNNIADDSAAIQAAFDFAFGPASSPHGNGGGPSNFEVYFPPGTYKILTPVSVTAVWGGRIFGAGALSSIISFQGTITPVVTASLTAKIDNGSGSAGTTLNVSAISVGKLGVGTYITGAGVSAGTQITALISGTGLTGTYTVNNSQNIASEAMTGNENICPALWLNGCNRCEITGLSFVATSDPTNHQTACIWDGPNGDLGGSSAHGNLITNVTTSTASYGIIHGSVNSAANSENTYVDCELSSHEQVGLFLSGANTLNMRMYGGALDSCGVAGIKTNNSATVPIVSNVACSQNFDDFNFAASGTCHLDSVRTESASFVKTNAVAKMTNCIQNAQGGTITGSTSSTTLTVTNTGTAGNNIRPGMVIYGTDSTNSLPQSPPTRITAYGSGTGGTGTYTISAAGSPGNLSSCTLTIRPVFAQLVGAAQVSMDGCGSPFDPVIISASNSIMSLSNNAFFDQNASSIPADFFKFFTGQMLAYDVACLGAFTVANLPTANARFKGVCMFVTDSTVAMSTHFGDIVAGTGANAVPVTCDGTNWRIG